MAEGSRASFYLKTFQLNGYFQYELKFAELNLVLIMVVGPSGPQNSEPGELFWGEDEPGQIGMWAHPDFRKTSFHAIYVFLSPIPRFARNRR